MSYLQKALPYLKNKYTIAFLAFLTWLLFFDSNDLISQFSRQQKLEKLKEQKAFFQKNIKETKKELKELTTDPRTLERFAREKYLMKKKNEDIFVIREEEEQKKEP